MITIPFPHQLPSSAWISGKAGKAKDREYDVLIDILKKKNIVRQIDSKFQILWAGTLCQHPK